MYLVTKKGLNLVAIDILKGANCSIKMVDNMKYHENVLLSHLALNAKTNM